MRTRWLSLSVILFSFVLQSENPQTDGVLSTGEWDNARRFNLENGNSIMILLEGNKLRVALTGPSSFWSHMYISDGTVVKVMHVSAALDDITYKKEGSSWNPSDEFKYEMRERVLNDDTRAKMQAYYNDHGWVANNMNMGSGRVAEIEINLRHYKEPLFFAAAIATAKGENITITPFPATVTDNTILHRLVQGYAVDSLDFQPGTWHRLSL